MATESCDHSRAGASSPLVELGELEGDVYQRSQDRLDEIHKEQRTSDFLFKSFSL